MESLPAQSRADHGVEHLGGGGRTREAEAEPDGGLRRCSSPFRASSSLKPALKLRSSMRWPWFPGFSNRRSRQQASRTLAGSTPFLLAKAKASATARTPMPVTIWLAALPPGRHRRRRRGRCSAHGGESRFGGGKARAAEPPAMIDRVPAMAPTSPPETGASLKSTPPPPTAFRCSRAAAGRWCSCPPPPGRAAPLDAGLSITSATSGASATMEMTRSASRAASAGLLGLFAPAWRSGCIGFGRRAQTVTVAAGLEEIEGHRASHDAQADESDTHETTRGAICVYADWQNLAAFGGGDRALQKKTPPESQLCRHRIRACPAFPRLRPPPKARGNGPGR